MQDYIKIFSELLEFADNCFSDVLEYRDEYILSDDEIKAIDDNYEKEIALANKRNNDFLKKAYKFLDKIKKEG